MGTLRLKGATSGYTEIKAADAASNDTIDLSTVVTSANAETLLPDFALTSETYTPPAGAVLETFASLCDGSSVTVSSGTYSTTDVTAVQAMNATYADVTGSAITYTPPSDASRVIYEFSFQLGSTGSHDIGHFRFYIDGVEATDARVSTGGQSFVEYGRTIFKWIISIGSANAATGAQATWTAGKEMKIQARAYATANDPKLHATYYFDGAVSEQFSRPSLTITAIK